MTGAFIFGMVDGQRQPIEIEHATKEERETFFEKTDPLPWIEMLCKTLRENEELLDSLVEEGILKKTAEEE